MSDDSTVEAGYPISCATTDPTEASVQCGIEQFARGESVELNDRDLEDEDTIQIVAANARLRALLERATGLLRRTYGDIDYGKEWGTSVGEARAFLTDIDAELRREG